MKSRVIYRELADSYVFDRKETKGGNYVINSEIANYILHLEKKLQEKDMLSDAADTITKNVMDSYKRENAELKQRLAKFQEIFDPNDLFSI